MGNKPDLPGFLRHRSSGLSAGEPCMGRRRTHTTIDLATHRRSFADQLSDSLTSGKIVELENEDDEEFTEEDRRMQEAVNRMSFFIPGINGPARCLGGRTSSFRSVSQLAPPQAQSNTRRLFLERTQSVPKLTRKPSSTSNLSRVFSGKSLDKLGHVSLHKSVNNLGRVSSGKSLDRLGHASLHKSVNTVRQMLEEVTPKSNPKAKRVVPRSA